MDNFHVWLEKKYETASKIAGPSIFAPLAQSSKQVSQGTFGTKDVLKIKQNFTPKQIRRDRKATGVIEHIENKTCLAETARWQYKGKVTQFFDQQMASAIAKRDSKKAYESNTDQDHLVAELSHQAAVKSWEEWRQNNDDNPRAVDAATEKIVKHKKARAAHSLA